MARGILDGPGMGYGPPGGRDRRAAPIVTVVLALCCLLLAVTLAAVLLRPTGPTAAPVVTVTASPAPGPSSALPTPVPSPTVSGPATPSASASPSATLGTDATPRIDEPAGVREAASTFLRGWREPKKSARVALLQVSATDSLLDLLADVDPDKIPEAKPVGKLTLAAATDYAAAMDQRLSDRSTVRMQLIYEPASRYGWLVDTIEPVE